MRELLLIVFVCGLAAVALWRPRFGLYSYIWFALMRPDYFAWASGSFPFSPVLAIATLVGSLRYFQRYVRVLQHSLTRTLILFQLPIVASVILAVNPKLSLEPFFEFERIVLMSLMIPVLIETRSQLRELFLVMALSLGMVGLKFGLWGLMVGGVSYTDGYAGLDNNGLALALVIAFPLCWYIRGQVESRWLKMLLLGMMFTEVSTVVMTRSRGGSLALATTFLLIWFRSKHKVGLAILVFLLAAPSIYLVRDLYFKRMATLSDPTQDSSANSRIILSEAAFNMWKDYPYFGVGFGNENAIALLPRYMSLRAYQNLKVHNTYMQLLVDSGIFALPMFLYLLFGAIIRLGRSVTVTRRASPGFEGYPMALQTALIAIAQYGLSGGRERYDCLYFLLMAAATWLLLQRQPSEALQTAPAAPPVLAEA